MTSDRDTNLVPPMTKVRSRCRLTSRLIACREMPLSRAASACEIQSSIADLVFFKLVDTVNLLE